MVWPRPSSGGGVCWHSAVLLLDIETARERVIEPTCSSTVGGVRPPNTCAATVALPWRLYIKLGWLMESQKCSKLLHWTGTPLTTCCHWPHRHTGWLPVLVLCDKAINTLSMLLFLTAVMCLWSHNLWWTDTLFNWDWCWKDLSHGSTVHWLWSLWKYSSLVVITGLWSLWKYSSLVVITLAVITLEVQFIDCDHWKYSLRARDHWR